MNYGENLNWNSLVYRTCIHEFYTKFCLVHLAFQRLSYSAVLEVKVFTYIKRNFFFYFLVCEHSTGIKPSNFGCNGSSLLLPEGGPSLEEFTENAELSKDLSRSQARISLECWLFSSFEFFKSRISVTAQTKERIQYIRTVSPFRYWMRR